MTSPLLEESSAEKVGRHVLAAALKAAGGDLKKVRIPPAPSEQIAPAASVAHHVEAIRALADKLAHAEAEVEQYQIAIGQHIRAIKEARPDDWEEIVRTECDLGRSRAYELLAISDGTKTAAQVRSETNARKVKHRQSVRSGTDSDDQEPKLNAVGRPLSPSYDPDYRLRTPLTSISRLYAPMRGAPYVGDGHWRKPIAVVVDDARAINAADDLCAPPAVTVTDLPGWMTAEEAEASYQETLFAQACLLWESMADETRQRFLARLQNELARAPDSVTTS
jgi:hypothetical protein